VRVLSAPAVVGEFFSGIKQDWDRITTGFTKIDRIRDRQPDDSAFKLSSTVAYPSVRFRECNNSSRLAQFVLVTTSSAQSTPALLVHHSKAVPASSCQSCKSCLVNPVLSRFLADHFALNHDTDHMRGVFERVTVIKDDVSILARFQGANAI
jgi:hypothetical protein